MPPWRIPIDRKKRQTANLLYDKSEENGYRPYGMQMIDILWQWMGWVAAVIATVFAVRGTIKFDVNDWLKDRRNQKEKRLRMLCPHVYMTEEQGKPAVRSAFISPVGTLVWQCQQCGYVTHDRYAVQQDAKIWAANPDALIERHQKMEKLAKKLNRD